MERVDQQQSIFIIAEAGVNHNGSLELAKKLVDVAAEAGADAVKFQTFKAESLVSQSAPKAQYQIKNTASYESQLTMLKGLELSRNSFLELAYYCKERKIEFMSTPFDEESLDFLVSDCRVRRLKIPSGELTNAPLLIKSALSSLPVIMSTGMANLAEIREALAALACGYEHLSQPSHQSIIDHGNRGKFSLLKNRVTLLHCTTEYPAPVSEVNLTAMAHLGDSFDLDYGYSDHTEGITVPIAAAALGARVIEKHFTLDRSMEGPDHKASLEPGDLYQMVKAVRQVEQALGDGEKRVTASELKNIPIARKSLVATKPIRKGEVFTKDNLGSKRPGMGISPMYYWDYLGTKAQRSYQPDELIEP